MCCIIKRRTSHFSIRQPLTAKIWKKLQQSYYLSKKNFSNGPAKLAKALAITKEQNKCSLLQNDFFIFEKEKEAPPIISTSPRINIDYAEEYTLKPWRFFESVSS